MKKDSIINTRIEKSAKLEFLKLCEESHTDASHEIRLFIYSKIKELKGSRISLKQFKNEHNKA